MRSPPGTSPTPVWPALSVSKTILRVKNGPWAPLRLSSMLSRPATGTTRMAVTMGVSEWVGEGLMGVGYSAIRNSTRLISPTMKMKLISASAACALTNTSAPLKEPVLFKM